MNFFLEIGMKELTIFLVKLALKYFSFKFMLSNKGLESLDKAIEGVVEK
jgi:hypothetical protein